VSTSTDFIVSYLHQSTISSRVAGSRWRLREGNSLVVASSSADLKNMLARKSYDDRM
jgi:hypothetical protein